MASQWRALYSSQLVWLAFRAAYGLQDFCAVFPPSELYRVALREAPIWDAHSTTDGCDSKTGRHVLIFRDLLFCVFISVLPAKVELLCRTLDVIVMLFQALKALCEKAAFVSCSCSSRFFLLVSDHIVVSISFSITPI